MTRTQSKVGGNIMPIKVINGNLFASTCQTLVNTINCVGAMGAGIALECRLRYPAMFEKYVQLCTEKRFAPGLLWLYKGGADEKDINNKWILNFPTKIHWKYPSRIEWGEAGLEKFLAIYKEKGITSIAFPVLGGLNGGLDPEKVISVMCSKLAVCEIPVEIYQYRADAPDDLFDRFKDLIKSKSESEIIKLSGLRINYVQRIVEILKNPEICQLNQLARFDGIGAKTLEKAFGIMRQQNSQQMELQL